MKSEKSFDNCFHKVREIQRTKFPSRGEECNTLVLVVLVRGLCVSTSVMLATRHLFESSCQLPLERTLYGSKLPPHAYTLRSLKPQRLASERKPKLRNSVADSRQDCMLFGTYLNIIILKVADFTDRPDLTILWPRIFVNLTAVQTLLEEDI